MVESEDEIMEEELEEEVEKEERRHGRGINKFYGYYGKYGSGA